MVKRIKRLLILLMIISVCFSSSYSINGISVEVNDDLDIEQKLENYKDITEAEETLNEDTTVTTMDENGDVYPLEETEAAMLLAIDDDINSVESISVAEISNSSTAVVNFRTKSSSGINTEYTEVTTARAGYTNGYYAADGAFLGYDNESNPTKVKFMQAGVVGWVNVDEVQVLEYTSSAVNTLSKYYVKNGRIYHGISTNLANSTYGSSLDYGPKPSYLKEGVEYYSYDGHYFYEGSTQSSYATMLNDYRNNSRANSVNSNSPYYNYYEYLSHRSVTTYTAEQLNSAINSMVGSSESNYGRTSKLRNTGSAFIENQNKYGTNALLMLAVAANESAWGCSSIAANNNNLFGHAAYDSDPSGSANGYSSVEYSIYYHSSQFISKGYLDPVTDGRYFGANVGDKASGINVKYASDPYWGEKAAAVCWKIDSYLGSEDSYKYTIGIKDTINTNHSVVNIKSDASSSSSTLYSTYPISSKTTYSSYAPSNYAFVILSGGDKDGYYKIQSDGAVNSNRTGIINTPSQAEYDFDKDYGFIPGSSVVVVSQGSNSISSVSKDTENTAGEPTGKDSNEPTISYQANCQSVGWLDQVTEPNTAGTTGRSLELYQLKLNLENVSSEVVLTGKVYSNGELLNYDNITSETVIGNTSIAMQIVNFTIKNLSGYKLQYRVHSADLGWQTWTDQGNDAGVSDKNIQAIDFRLVPGSIVTNQPIAYYQAFIEDEGWLKYVENEEVAGTEGQSLGLQAFRIGIENLDNYKLTVKTYDCKNGEVTYDNVTDTTVIGSTDESLPLSAISAAIEDTDGYEIEYRTHCSDIGWSSWVRQGVYSGDIDSNEQIEAIQFKIVKTAYPTIISLNKSSLDLYIKNTETLIASLSPTNVENEVITWESSNTNIATVDNNGGVTGIAPGTATITAATANGKTATCEVTVTESIPSVTYSTHVQDIGWQQTKYDGESAGTTGQSKRLEAIQINLDNQLYDGDIQYQAHIQDIGWQDWKSNGVMAGTSGQSKRLEAIKIELTGEMADEYDIYYRVHAQNFGWLDWAKNGESAGTAGYSYRLEAIEIKLVKKGAAAPGGTATPYRQRYIKYSTHVQDYGWQSTAYDGQTSGTTGQSKRLEAIQINLDNQLYDGDIQYQAHIQDIGWQDWKSNGVMAGTSGQSKRLEAIKIELTGEMADEYDIYYRVHAQNFGWLDWAKNGASAGTAGYSYRLEAIEIVLAEKDSEAPGSIANSFIYK